MFQSIPGWFGHLDERIQLAKIVSQYNYKNCIGVEIGSLFGSSSSIIAQSIPNGTLYCLDTWSGHSFYNPEFSDEQIEKHNLPRPEMKATLEKFKEYTKDYSNIKPLQGQSPQCICDWDQPVDFVFLDAEHKNPSDSDNINFWLPKIKLGGSLIGHDLSVRYPDVIKNVVNLSVKLKQPPTIVRSLWSFTIK